MIVRDHKLSMHVILAMFEEVQKPEGVINLDGPPLAASAKSKSKAGRPRIEREPNKRGEYDSIDAHHRGGFRIRRWKSKVMSRRQ